ncbi:MAG TPA: complex I subunit 5 family protein [Kiritimatiellia bacterium]|nr:complex I subunit 5 family protein [Kiritimatiellia bacterium]
MPTLFSLGGIGEILIALALALPLVMGLVALRPVLAIRVSYLVPIAAIPALILSLSEPVTVTWNGLLLGATFASGGSAAVWLFFTATLWLCASWFGAYYMAHDSNSPRYTFFFLWAMAGNFGLILARDPVGFFTSFALMSVLSYGLIIHDGKPASRVAGRVYLGMALLGEILQFAAMSMLFFPIIGKIGVINFQSLEMLPPPGALVVGLLIAGFGIKAGLPGLHVWLPMAHPVAPTPASAVLSGSMIKAGLLGWMAFLPLGRMALPDASMILIILGLTGAVTAALIGVLQSNPKAVLAYSSVSQMGLITTGIGVGLGYPASWPMLKWAVAAYAAHHAFAKCLLFLAVGLKTTRPLAGWERTVFWGGVLFAALALIGAPLTSGAYVKVLLKDGIVASSFPAAGSVVTILTFAATGTALLMIRYSVTLRRLAFDEHHEMARGAWIPWLILLAMVMAFTPMFIRELYAQHILTAQLVISWLKSLWPPALGAVLYASIHFLWIRLRWRVIQIPQGDLYHLLCWIPTHVHHVRGTAGNAVRRTGKMYAGATISLINRAAEKSRQFLEFIESRLAGWSIGGVAAVLVGVLIFWLSLQ